MREARARGPAPLEAPVYARRGVAARARNRPDHVTTAGEFTMSKITRATAYLAAATLALSACKHDGAGPGVAPDRADRPRTTSPAIGELLAGVPGSAAAIAFVDL